MKSKMMMETVKLIALITFLVSCSSGGSKNSKSQNLKSENLTSENFSSDGEDSESTESSRGESNQKTTLSSESGASKKELFDAVQISLGSNDDAMVEKSVANLLSLDQSDAKALNTLALYHFSKGRHSLAKMIFKSILDKDKKNSSALNNMGVIYSNQGDRRQAIESFRKALAINPGHIFASANIGAIFAYGKDYAKAKSYLHIAYKGGVKDLSLLNNYALTLMADGDSGAEKIFEEAIEIGASDSTIAFNYALFLTYVKKDFKEASEILDKIRFMGVPNHRKGILAKMEETISGHANEETKGP